MSVMQVLSLRVSRGSEQEAGGAAVLLPEPALTPSPEGRPILDEDSLLVWILILFVCLFDQPTCVAFGIFVPRPDQTHASCSGRVEL